MIAMFTRQLEDRDATEVCVHVPNAVIARHRHRLMDIEDTSEYLSALALILAKEGA